MKTITKVLPLLTVALLTSGCTTMSGGNYSKRTEKAMKMFNAMDSSFLSILADISVLHLMNLPYILLLVIMQEL